MCTKVVEVRVLPSRGTNHVKVQGDEAIVMRCGRKADRIMALSGWLARQAQGGVYTCRMHGTYRFNKKLVRLVSFLPKAEAGLVRSMDKTMQGTWMARKRRQEPMIKVRRLRNRRKGVMQLGGFDVDDEWAS